MKNRLQWELDPRRITLIVAGLGLFLLVIHAITAWLWAEGGPELVDYRYLTMFDLDVEEGFGTWFAAVTLLVSLVMLEWLPGRSKPWAKIGIGLGLILFMMLAWGQQLIGATEGIANLWLYFGTAAATLVVVQLDERGQGNAAPATSASSDAGVR